jgi:endonuclease/exonuclease/phosphatase family metal-dependent hydrolase
MTTRSAPRGAWTLAGALLLGCGGSDPEEVDYPLTLLEAPGEAPDVTERLCAEATDPDSASETTFIDCRWEGGVLAGAQSPRSDLVVLTYNLERGHALDEVLEGFATELLPQPDLFLLSETDRGCGRTGGRHTTWELASALGMNFVYATEFMEVQGEGTEVTEVCEHGNALLSRYPLANVEVVRHAENVSWYTPPEERGATWSTRLGGRVAIVADVVVGERVLHVSSMHLASGALDGEVRAAQAREVVDLLAERPFARLGGGDLNAGTYVFDLQNGTANDGVGQAFLGAGYADSHAALDPGDRVTLDNLPFVIDLLFADAGSFRSPAICREGCEPWSDHYPVWATWRIEE